MSAYDDLMEYVYKHTARGECKCDKCIDRGDKPDPIGHTVNMVYFKVAAVNSPNAVEFRKLTSLYAVESGGDVDPFDRNEHSYMEIGGWLGDQGDAFVYMALGVLLGVFHLLSPDTIFPGGNLPQAIRMQLAGNGMISIRVAADPFKGETPLEKPVLEQLAPVLN